MFHASSNARNASLAVLIATLTAAGLAKLYLYLESRPAEIRVCIVNTSSSPLRGVSYGYRGHSIVRGDMQPDSVLEGSANASEPVEALLAYTRPDGIARSVTARWTFGPGHYGSYYVIISDDGVWQQAGYQSASFPALRAVAPCRVTPPNTGDFRQKREWPPRAGENAFLDEVRERRRAWRARHVTDYALVASADSAWTSSPGGTQDPLVRSVVRRGSIVSARGALDGRPAVRGRTMEDLFELAEWAASSVSWPSRTPDRFEATYGPLDTIRSVFADPEELFADDEVSFRVDCFSANPDGCRLNPFTLEQCSAANGRPSSAGTSCHPGSRVGVMDGSSHCCRLHPLGLEPDLANEACQSAGGEPRFRCEWSERSIGKSSKTTQACCRLAFR